MNLPARPDGTLATWRCRRHQLPLGSQTYVMGIINTDPDSFSGDGVRGEEATACAVQQGVRMVAEGAHILDIGGESTRPGAAPVAPEEELRRVLPVVSALAKRVQVPLSIDTTKAAVARPALTAGASIINDISGGTFDAALPGVAAEFNAGYIVMHLRGTPTTMGWSRESRRPGTAGGDIIEEVLEFLAERCRVAMEAGVEPGCLAIDGGFGFGKSVAENLALIRRGRELKQLGYPLLSGTSRKSTIGKVLGDLPVEEREWGTAATVALAIAGGADIVRVHHVAAMAQVARLADAVVRPGAQPQETTATKPQPASGGN